MFSGPEAAGFAALASEVVQRKSVEWALRQALRDAQRSEDNARSAARQLELVTDAPGCWSRTIASTGRPG